MPAMAQLADRIAEHGPALLEHLSALYGDRARTTFERVIAVVTRAHEERPSEMLSRDEEIRRDWFRDHRQFGAVCYVDRWAGSLPALEDRITYLEELGVTFLHLMPLFAVPEGANDGGYAVSDYRTVRPDLGTMGDLRALAGLLHSRGVALSVDFVFNHTADDHRWARLAASGDPQFAGYYHFFDDRSGPDEWDVHLREIFPEEHGGCFTQIDDGRWVWTTFHSYQWDLDYRNPDVFVAMLDEMLYLANVGVDVLRLDAVPFIWKEEGTNCENRPQVHTLLRAFNRAVRIAAPALAFTSEAIVHPDDVVSYLEAGERAQCEISYNPLLMCELWEALATGFTHLLRYSVRTRFHTPPGCAWLNYVRSHDDIGWGFADEDAWSLSIDPGIHRLFLNRWYTGEAPGSWARGLPFQPNEETGDLRISGTTASLAGLESALEEQDPASTELALRRIELLHGLALSMGGLPLLYLGDELGTRNDYGFRSHPQRGADSRWAHRPEFDTSAAARRHDPASVEGRVFDSLSEMVRIRASHPAFGAGSVTVVHEPADLGVFAVTKREPAANDEVTIVANFTDRAIVASAGELALDSGSLYEDLRSGRAYPPSGGIAVAPYDLLWLISR